MTYIFNNIQTFYISFGLASLFSLVLLYSIVAYSYKGISKRTVVSHTCGHSSNTATHKMPVPSVKCPSCLNQGKTVWVIPGKNCPVCGTPCSRLIYQPTPLNILKGLFVSFLLAAGYAIHYGYLFELSDAPRPWGLYFQDSASPQMEALVELHNNIMYYLVIILFSVGWILASAVSKFRSRKSGISNKYVSHGTLVELIWTITPGLILILIAFTSFKLLYLMDEVSDTNMTLYIEGHQWYWSYQYPDFVDEEGEFIEYDSYLVPDSDLEYGALRMLDVDERVVVPEISHTRLAIASGDVIHSYGCPSLAIKADAYPGRLNQASALINRVGVFYGQCSELCGLLHSSMPISIQCVSLEKFLAYLWEK